MTSSTQAPAEGRIPLVTNARGLGARASETSDEVWDSIVAVNLEGAWRLAQAAAPTLLRRDWARFVGISSAGGEVTGGVFPVDAGITAT